ncbi:MAG: hypothetical protein IKU36_06180 [Bacteroidales bacterium]|nr:hypothetical protein [Bacteroidales bacterium]
MITLSELKSAFSNYRYYYGSAPIGTKLPYIVAIGSNSSNFQADSKVYSKKFGIQLNYYSKTKDENKESEIESILDSLGVIWEKTEAFDEDQTFFLTSYTFWR